MVGVAVFVAFAVSAVLLQQRPSGFTSFMIGLSSLVVLGLLDDRMNLRASIKFVAQIACVALMVLPSNTVIRHVGAILGSEQLLLQQWAVPVTIIAIVGLINAYNMIDGVDGLAGSLSLVALLWFALAAAMIGLQDQLLLALLVAFCVIGFLVFNLRWRSRASVFLGDAGSMMLGAVLSLAVCARCRGCGVRSCDQSSAGHRGRHRPREPAHDFRADDQRCGGPDHRPHQPGAGRPGSDRL
jgi:UDP-GlcNAc:undecaprenyl-phosphate GlcNAc-1-phosphate transferase